jgi:carboxyl-terminal processing protease
VKEAYVDPVDDKKLMQSAVRGLLLDLDPHSAYLRAPRSARIRRTDAGAYTGVGVELMTHARSHAQGGLARSTTRRPRARASRPATSSSRSTARPWPISGDDGEGGSGRLRGAVGTKVVLTIVREGKPKPFDVTLTRERIRVASVRSRLLEPGYGYIRVATFQADTAADFSRALDKLEPAASCAAWCSTCAATRAAC